MKFFSAVAVFSVVMFNLIPSGLVAEPNDSKTSEPEPSALSQIHYEIRTRSFREQNLVYQNIVLLGDNITEAFDVTDNFPGRRVLNRGIGSDVIGNHLSPKDKRGVLKRLDESVFDCSPTDVFILIGINDLGQGHSPEVVEAGYREMLEKIRQRLPKVRLHLQSLLPTRGRFAKHNKNIIDVNRRIQKLAEEFDCDYIDLHSVYADENGEIREDVTSDGLHLKPEAYGEWTAIINGKMGWK